jgi:hypothetical protein
VGEYTVTELLKDFRLTSEGAVVSTMSAFKFLGRSSHDGFAAVPGERRW